MRRIDLRIIKDFYHKVPVWVWYGLAALTPFFATTFRLFFVDVENVDLFHSFPTWNDEGLWWHQIGAMAEYGQPLGYFGYNGTHAQIGRFGPWGFAILLPYAAFAKIFGWNYNSMALANMLFLCLANALFMLLTRMEKKNIKWFVICACTSYITIYYANTSMSEPLRFSMGIILAGMLYRLYRFGGGKVYKYIVVPAVLLYCISAYLPFVLFIPYYVFGIRKESSLRFRIIVSFFATVTAAWIFNGISTLFAAPYTESAVKDILAAVQENPMQGIIMFVNRFFESLLEVDLTGILKFVSEGSLIGYFDLTYYMLMILLAVDLAVKVRKNEKMECVCKHTCIFCLFLLASFIFIFAGFYSTYLWTWVRGLNVAFCAVTCLLVLCGNKRIIVALTCFTILIFPRIWVTYDLTRYPTNAGLDRYYTTREELSECIDLAVSGDADPWENTCGIYGYSYDPYFVMCLPAGIGINFVLDETVCPYIKYAVVCGIESNSATVERLQGAGYDILWTDGKNALYVMRESI
ncbi:MAG: hypothetical protein NC432_00660 [Roseburia sp.]|nr:hypothetical protein [Roseburia sp.]MCM1099643.1 hypothetical protein [Ruminococcus flavefaciens]